MSNVKKYIEQHKGQISVKSEPGFGTTFTIRLPIIEKKLTPKDKEDISRETVIPDKNILLVEDERSLSDVQSSLLMGDPFNHHVNVVESGQSAIDMFEKSTYDFISLDYMLPGSITGMDVYRHIRDRDKKSQSCSYQGT